VLELVGYSSYWSGVAREEALYGFHLKVPLLASKEFLVAIGMMTGRCTQAYEIAATLL